MEGVGLWVVGLWVVGWFVAGFGWLGPKKLKNNMVFAIFCQREAAQDQATSCLATQPWATFAHRRGGFEQNSCTRERGALSGVPPKVAKSQQFFAFLGTPRTGRYHPRGCKRGGFWGVEENR